MNLTLGWKELANVTGSIVIDRNGRIYGGINLGGGVGAPLPVSGSLAFGGIDNNSPDALKSFLTGNSSNVTVAPVLGYGTTWNPSTSSNEFVVGTPQASISAGRSWYWFTIPGVKW